MSSPFGRWSFRFLRFCQARTQVEPDHFGERHREMREAVRVDRDALNPLDLALAQGALDGGAGLSAVQDDWLIVEDAPLVEHVSVSPNGKGPAPRIDPCRPEVARCLQAHHVGRGEQTASPEARDAMLAHEAQYRVICRPQPSLHLDLEHHLPKAVGCQRGHHAHQFGGRKIGAEPHEGGVERHQFPFRPGRPAKKGPPPAELCGEPMTFGRSRNG